ncbi:hypothetical protein L2E82_50427 [Cichorium intybus]|nr:hypothetical protein L2E82_50427 [Cichorium intybus]
MKNRLSLLFSLLVVVDIPWPSSSHSDAFAVIQRLIGQDKPHRLLINMVEIPTTSFGGNMTTRRRCQQHHSLPPSTAPPVTAHPNVSSPHAQRSVSFDECDISEPIFLEFALCKLGTYHIPSILQTPTATIYALGASHT